MDIEIKRDTLCAMITVGKSKDGVIWYLSKPAWSEDEIYVTSMITQALQIDLKSDIFKSWIENIKNSNRCYNPSVIQVEQNIVFKFDESCIGTFLD